MLNELYIYERFECLSSLSIAGISVFAYHPHLSRAANNMSRIHLFFVTATQEMPAAFSTSNIVCSIFLDLTVRCQSKLNPVCVSLLLRSLSLLHYLFTYFVTHRSSGRVHFNTWRNSATPSLNICYFSL